MIKCFSLLFVFLISLSTYGATPEGSSEIFWMIDSVEWEPLRQNQKSFYLNHIGAELKVLFSQESWSQKKLQKISSDLDQWDELESRVNKVCYETKEKKMRESCEKMKTYRSKTFEMSSLKK